MKYEEWPEDFKKNFKQLMKATKRTRLMELKNKFKTQYETYYQLTQNLLKLKENFTLEDKNMNEANFKILDTLMYNILPILINFNTINATEKLEICKINTIYKEYDNIYSCIDKQLKDYFSSYNTRMPTGPCNIMSEFKEIIS